MVENFKSEQGNTLVELIMVMILMLFFGITIFTLIQTGSYTEQKIIDNKNAESDARIAMSYINVKIRKNDIAGNIEVAAIEATGQQALLIRSRTFEGEYDSWIYFLDGALVECMVRAGQQPDDNLSMLLVDIYDFQVGYDSENNTILYQIKYVYSDEIQEINSTIKLRSDRVAGFITL